MKNKFFVLALIYAVLLCGICPASAQWITQVNKLSPGWNAVFLHVDASYDTINNLVAKDASNPILEIWLWKPTISSLQFVQSPEQPADASSQWISWNRTKNASPLQRLVGNAAYLVRVSTNVTSYNWNIKGVPVVPNYQWTSTGLNFVGFPTMADYPPNFYNYLAPVPEMRQNSEIFQYLGQDFGPNNPAQVVALRAVPVMRGQAFWIRSGSHFNRYFGPFEVSLLGSAGVEFKDDRSTRSFRVCNHTAASLTISMRLVASEAPPDSEVPINGIPPLLLRGPVNTSTMTYGFSNLVTGGTSSWTLAPKGQSGSEVEIVLGLNRALMMDSPGSLQAAILRFSDSLGFSQIDVPVSATTSSKSGLWVGSASVSQVGAYLKSYGTNSEGEKILTTNGHYLVSSLKTDPGSVSRPFPLRLIIHNPGMGNAVLLQRVFCGFDAETNSIIARSEASLNRQFLKQSRRISAVHLPWSPGNTAWAFDSLIGGATNLNVTVVEEQNDRASSPFIHAYHPDHDNLDSTFSNVLPQGSESYKVIRTITLTPSLPPNDFASITEDGQKILGSYAETVTIEGLARAGGVHDSRKFQILGTFTLNRISDIPTLTSAP